MSYVEYRIPLQGTAASDLPAIKGIIEANARIFDKHLLANVGDESAYSVVEGAFSITAIDTSFFEYQAAINFFAGCRDINEDDRVTGRVPYSILEQDIVFSLDETTWQVEV